MGEDEVFGFISGALCVWLTVREHVWNWPIGIINSAFFTYLFLRSHLYADMSLQVVYIVLGFLGWYWWLYGGKDKKELKITTTPVSEWVILIVLGIASTVGMTWYLQTVNDAAPFWDALTTVLSLIAQYQLTKKYVENWYVWIIADVIYIALYAYKDLYLTSVLYVLFLLLCISGLREWRKTQAGYPKAAQV